MGISLNKLLSIAGSGLCYESPRLAPLLIELAGNQGNQLVELLGHKNGFYAFENALHVFPSGCSDLYVDLETWNNPNSWRKYYWELVKDSLFFAEDVFGVQFCIRGGKIQKFDPEAGEFEDMAENLEEWATKILEDPEYEIGYELVQAWQQQNGSLLSGSRLLPKTPFIFGGEYEIKNLYMLDSLKAMEFRADIWRQIRDLPDGTEIKLKIVQ